MADLTDKYKIWEHSAVMTALNERRAQGRAETMTCLAQLHDILLPIVQPGWSLLDAGCGPGHYYHLLKGLGLCYSGLDYTAHYIEMGRKYMPAAGLNPEHLRVGTIENIDNRYDVVVCFNTLLYCPDFRQPLERLCEAADRFLVIRTLLDEKNEYRYVRDGELDPGFNHLKAYFNIYAIREIKTWIEAHGFRVEMPVDRRTQDRPECVNNLTHPWRILFAERVRDERIDS